MSLVRNPPAPIAGLPRSLFRSLTTQVLGRIHEQRLAIVLTSRPSALEANAVNKDVLEGLHGKFWRLQMLPLSDEQQRLVRRRRAT